MRVNEIPEIARLTVAEKILLLEDLWDSIAAKESSVPVPPSHREELDRRLAEYEKNPGWLLTLDDLRGRIEATTSLSLVSSSVPEPRAGCAGT
jgi:putative addiction module component (TIGR02574 family)